MNTIPSASDSSASASSTSSTAPHWERGLLERLLLAQAEEQKRARRWNMVRRGLTLVVIAWVAYLGFSSTHSWHSPVDTTTPHTAVVNLSGVIEAKGEVDAMAIMDALRAAFEAHGSAGVVLRMNSPGGSPVQSALIYDEVRRLRALYPKKQVIAVVEDVCASGGYFVASAADSIVVNQSSLVGSIGVRMDGFGFTEAMKKIGVERRLLTAGENKAMLDPFLPEDPRHKKATQRMLAEVHEQFIEAVKAGRGKRLSENPEVFSGMVYTGAAAIKMGLADGLGSVASVARDVFKAEDLVDYTAEPSVAERLARQLGAGMGESVTHILKTSAVGLAPTR